MNPFGHLNDENEEQIKKYIRFFRQKKDGIVRSIGSEIDETKEDRLNEDMFSKEDMLEFSDYLSSMVKTQISSEVADIINMNALILSKVLESAQSQGMHVDLDIGGAENHALLQAVEKINLDALPKTRKTKVDTLPSFKDEAKAARDEMGRLSSANNILQDRFNNVQGDASKLAKENASLKNEITGLNRRISELESASKSKSTSASAAESKAEREAAQQISRLEDEVERLRGENSKRLSEAPQFLQMRDLMKSQTEKIKQLRRKLQRYEPEETAKEADDDDEF